MEVVVHDTFEEDGGTLNHWKLTVNTSNSRSSTESAFRNPEVGVKPNFQFNGELKAGVSQFFRFNVNQQSPFHARLNDTGTLDSRIRIINASGDLVGQGSDVKYGSVFRGQLAAGDYWLAVNGVSQQDSKFQLSMKLNGEWLTPKPTIPSSELQQEIDPSLDLLDRSFNELYGNSIEIN